MREALVGRMLVVAVWPVGVAVIMIMAALLAGRAEPARPTRAGAHPVPAPEPDTALSPGGNPAAQALRDAARFLIIIAIGMIAIYAVMALLGLPVTHQGHIIDKPVNHWVGHHRIHQWAHEMSKATKVGDTWTTRGAAVTAAVCLATTWPRMRWLPPVALAAISLIQHPLTHMIHLTDPRIGPPGFRHGTFPSGGSERCVAFYGLIAYLLWREFSGSRRAAIWSAAVVAALAFNEGYSRLYLGMHWATDVLSGWVYGLLILVAFIVAVRLVAGPARLPAGAHGASAIALPTRAQVGEGPR
jgi:membrane-associated phospholipid phosphatase